MKPVGNAKGRGRKREYGSDLAQRVTVSLGSSLYRKFAQVWKARGTTNISRAIQEAMRLWLSIEAGKNADGIAVPAGANDKAAHVHLTFPPKVHAALAKHAAKTGRTVPAVVREAVARYVSSKANAPEFAGVTLEARKDGK